MSGRGRAGTAVTGGFSSGFLFFFFFQAEDGIRDLYVTGVQTCALPISRTIRGAKRLIGRMVNAEEIAAYTRAAPVRIVAAPNGDAWLRIDAERRSPQEIGRASCRKECRSRWAPYH